MDSTYCIWISTVVTTVVLTLAMPISSSLGQEPCAGPSVSESDCDRDEPEVGGCKAGCGGLFGFGPLYCGEPWTVSRDPFMRLPLIDDVGDWFESRKEDSWLPITVGAWHWWHVDFFGRDSGYGIPSIPDTYFWYINADPSFDLPDGRKIGGHLELRLRENGFFRSFIPRQVWPWEAYGYIEDEDAGTLKAGLLYKQFGLFWDGVFFGNQAYFDGTKLDADYGLSWEKTTEIDDCMTIASFAQFFFHEDGSNGSFGGGDSESVPGYNERNTAVLRLVPTWTFRDGAVLALGVSGLVGQIKSSRPDLTDETVSAYAVDLDYYRGPWRMFLEGQQTFGVINPVRYVSGGPSNRITNFLAGIHYTHGAVTYRCSYSASLDANPDAMVNLVVAGTTVTLSKNVDLYFEYVNQQLDGNLNPANDGFLFHSLEMVINWHF